MSETIECEALVGDCRDTKSLCGGVEAYSATDDREKCGTAACQSRLWPALVSAGSAQAAATVVPLGTAGQFAVLAGSGITNTGASTIVGDVGNSRRPEST